MFEFCAGTLAEAVVGVRVEVKTSKPESSKRPLIATIIFFTFVFLLSKKYSNCLVTDGPGLHPGENDRNIDLCLAVVKRNSTRPHCGFHVWRIWSKMLGALSVT
jgi:hypothetical protein